MEAAARVLRATEPDVKLAPLAAWATLILSISSRNVGTNRSAMETIMARSWEGTPIRPKGLRSLSIPPTNSMAGVVMVRMDAQRMRRANCHVVEAPLDRPS